MEIPEEFYSDVDSLLIQLIDKIKTCFNEEYNEVKFNQLINLYEELEALFLSLPITISLGNVLAEIKNNILLEYQKTGKFDTKSYEYILELFISLQFLFFEKNIEEETVNELAKNFSNEIQNITEETPEIDSSNDVMAEFDISDMEKEVVESSANQEWNKDDYEDIILDFLEECNEIIENLEIKLIDLENNSDNEDIINEIFRGMHTLKGNSATINLQSMNTLAHKSENILDQIRNGEFPVTEDTIDILLSSVDLFKEIVSNISDNVNPNIDVSEVLHRLNNLQNGKESKPISTPVQKEQKITKDTPKKQSAQKRKSEVSSLRVDITKLDKVINLMGEIVTDKIRIRQKVTKLKSLISLIEDTITILQKSADINYVHSLSIDIEDRIADYKKKLNIDKDVYELYHKEVNELARIINLFKNMEASDTEQMDEKSIGYILEELDRIKRILSDHITEMDIIIDHLSLVSNEVQEGVMKLRMIPISQLFNKMPRAVRKISKTLGKKVNLVIEGENTELDKTIIEELNDPMIHLIRNSIDHGIEEPEVRIKKGKPEIGTLSIKAEHKGNQVGIIIEDDGKGIDDKIILQKAISKGLIEMDKKDSLAKDDILSLIFTPGFSSAEKITELSGRGVGMDVVKNNIQKLKGSIDVNSVVDKGTKITIRLPLTMAIMPVQIISSAAQTFAIPISFIEETINIQKNEILLMGQKTVFNLRGEMVSLVYLSEILELGIPPEYSEKEMLQAVIIRIGEKRIGFIVDSTIGQQEIVIKSLGYILKNVQHVSGATILGEGNIILILDILGIFDTARKKHISSNQPAGDITTQTYTGTDSNDMKSNTIMVVDDSKTVRASITKTLALAGYNVLEAEDGIEAYDIALNENIGLFTIDVKMPRMNGYDLVKKLRQTPQYEKTPMIMISSNEEEIDKLRGLDAGVDDYFTKPFFDNRLVKHIMKYLG